MIDVNVSLFRWPTRRLPDDDTKLLVRRLRANGITQAWAGSFEGLLHNDLTGVNDRLAAECIEQGEEILVPFGTINPMLPDWEGDLLRCTDHHRMPGIRLHPDFHRYSLDSEAIQRVFALASEKQLIVQLALRMEDVRTSSSVFSLAEVDTAPLAKTVEKFPQLQLVVLNWSRDLRGPAFGDLAQLKNVCFDIATLESAGGVGKLIQEVPYQQVLLGSHAPFFYHVAAMLKLRESELEEFITTAIAGGNAARLLAGN